MPEKSNNITRFWLELKRRRVIHVITVYASASFVIIELINNLAEPLNLPTRLSTYVIVVLAIGFPLAIILSWIYDLTSEGIEKTKPLNETPDEEKQAVPNAWKIATYVSFVVIIGLVALNVMGTGRNSRPGSVQSW
jgi:nucleoside recognition membrane protein YjiH